MTEYRIVELNNGQFVLQKLYQSRWHKRWDDVDTFTTEHKARARRELLEQQEQAENDKWAARAHATSIKRVVD